MKNQKSINWVVALKVEAEIIIKTYDLYLISNNSNFPIYKNKIGYFWLIISGIGEKNISKASEILFITSKAKPWTIWINIGIAGHISNNLGELSIVDKVNCEKNNKSFFPMIVLPLKITKLSLLTVDRPTKNYSSGNLIDMEGAYFFETTSKFVSRELILIIKIISDGPMYDYKNLNKKIILNYMKNNITVIKKIIEFYEDLSIKEYKRLKTPDLVVYLLNKWHFTFSEEAKLKLVIKKLSNFFSDMEIKKLIKNEKNSSDVLRKLICRTHTLTLDWK